MVTPATSADVEARVAVVGAGPQGLAAALHLVDRDPGLLRDLVVIDAAGGWLRAWDDRFARLDIGHLRSPGVHHPGCDAYELGDWCRRRDLASPVPSPYELPSTAAFRRFCDHLVARAGLDEHVVPTRVRRIEPGRRTTRLALADGTAVVAAHVVLATDPAWRRLPAWVADLPPVPVDALSHADDVDLRGLDLAGQHVAIVGGGLTAGHLAAGAAERGATVTLIGRRPLRERMFDTDPGWLGPKHLDAFRRLADPAQRLDAALTARDGGSMPPWMTRRISALGTRLRVLAPMRICAAERCGDRLRLVLGDETRVTADRLWLATGSRPDIAADRLTATLQATHPTRLAAGWPTLDDTLRWPGTNVHVLGRLAMLVLGPAAGNLWGARVGATRVAPAVSDPHGPQSDPTVPAAARADG
jgi:NADPH-dependent 2,4-dienoyl-CoA reductase/sulfur reductase-like enzyme